MCAHAVREFVEMIPEHAGPAFVERDAPAGNVPIPRADLRALHDQFETFRLRINGLFVHGEETFKVCWSPNGLRRRSVPLWQ